MIYWRNGYALAIFGYVAIVALLLSDRAWDPDEFEHLQGSWLISEGLTPYRDFFEHHTPLWHLVTAPVAGLMVPQSVDRAFLLMVNLRLASLACTAAITALTWLLARHLAGHRVAHAALALMLIDAFFMQSGIEIRPDPLSTLGIVGAVYALALAFASKAHPAAPEPSSSAALWIAVAGAAETWAILASQKALFAGPGLVVAFLWLASRQMGPRRIAMLALCGLAGAAAAAAPVLMWFAARDALGDFLHHSFMLNAGWTRKYSGMSGLLTIVARYDTILAAFSMAGALVLLWRLRRPGQRTLPLLALMPLLSLAAGAYILPVVQKQYLFMVVPLAAVCGGVAIDGLIRLIPAGWKRSLAVAGLAAMFLLSAARNLDVSFYHKDAETRAKLAYVLNTVHPDATIMGAWSPGIVFRRPAWFYHVLHFEVQDILSPALYRELADGLRTGVIHPALVDMDKAMLNMPGDILSELKRLYEPTGIAGLHVRRQAAQ